jgi:hypothetical protein
MANKRRDSDHRNLQNYFLRHALSSEDTGIGKTRISDVPW